jgi:hypothetical protein
MGWSHDVLIETILCESLRRQNLVREEQVLAA